MNTVIPELTGWPGHEKFYCIMICNRKSACKVCNCVFLKGQLIWRGTDKYLGKPINRLEVAGSVMITTNEDVDFIMKRYGIISCVVFYQTFLSFSIAIKYIAHFWFRFVLYWHLSNLKQPLNSLWRWCEVMNQFFFFAA